MKQRGEAGGIEVVAEGEKSEWRVEPSLESVW